MKNVLNNTLGQAISSFAVNKNVILGGPNQMGLMIDCACLSHNKFCSVLKA